MANIGFGVIRGDGQCPIHENRAAFAPRDPLDAIGLADQRLWIIDIALHNTETPASHMPLADLGLARQSGLDNCDRFHAASVKRSFQTGAICVARGAHQKF